MRDDFIHKVSGSFTEAIVKLDCVTKIVFRGTDIGDGGFVDHVQAAVTGGADPAKVDDLDIQADIAIDDRTRGFSQQTDALALTCLMRDRPSLPGAVR